MTDDKRNEERDPRGVDGLTEVLRLQAEALSRISERMAGMRGAPVEQAPAPPPPPKGSASASGMFPVLARDPVLSEESLPVLNSFKNFLDQERRRARKRILWVLLGFTVAFSAVLVVVAWMTSERARGLEADISQSKARAERNRMDSEAQIQRLGQMASMTATQNVSQMRKDITRNILWAHSVIASNVSSELSGRDSEMERLREKLSAIEVDNAMLARQLDELGRRLSALEDQGRGALESMSVEPEQPGRTNTPAPVMINSAKFGRSFQLRMPRD